MQNKDAIKTYNRSKVLEIICKKNEVYRAELSRITGLSMPTIMKITDSLMQSGMVVAAGKGESSGGKPPVLLELVPDSRLFVGVDVSGAMFKCIIMDLCGGIIFRRNCLKQELDRDSDDVLTIERFVEDTIIASGVDRSKISGLGVGVPGIVKADEGLVVVSIDFGWHYLDLRTPLEIFFGVPVFVENSSKVMALGEQWFGAGRHCEDFALITVGRGIGGAFIINDEIYGGFNNQSGEIGHMVIDPNGPCCKCGRRGCLETLASGKAIEQRARECIESGRETRMRAMAKKEPGKLTADAVFRAAKQGDPAAREIADQAIEYLAIGLNNLLALLDCQRLVLTGYVVKNNKYLLERVKEKINTARKIYYEVENPVDVELSTLGEEAAVIGAATIPLSNLIGNGGVTQPLLLSNVL